MKIQKSSPTRGERVLAFDQAASQSGYAFFEGEGNLMEAGIINPIPKVAKGSRRLHSLWGQFKEVIDRCKPEVIVLEEPVGNTDNFKTVVVLAHVQGILLQLCGSAGIDPYLVSPSTWQYVLNIRKRDRKERKKGAREYVADKYPSVSGAEQDVIDAVCLAECYFGDPTRTDIEESAF